MKYLLHILLGLNLLGTALVYVHTEQKITSVMKVLGTLQLKILDLSRNVNEDLLEDPLEDIERQLRANSIQTESELLLINSKLNTIDSSVEEIKDKLGISVW